MASAAVTPRLRTLGWNVHLLYGPEGEHFAGLFHPPGSDSLSYRDVIQELRLCFDLLYDADANAGPNDAWENVAFQVINPVSNSPQPLRNAPTTAAFSPRMVCGQGLDQSVLTIPADPTLPLARPPVVRLHVVRHSECPITAEQPLAAHLQGMSNGRLPMHGLSRVSS